MQETAHIENSNIMGVESVEESHAIGASQYRVTKHHNNTGS